LQVVLKLAIGDVLDKFDIHQDSIGDSTGRLDRL
jgi:hypothetical protein